MSSPKEEILAPTLHHQREKCKEFFQELSSTVPQIHPPSNLPLKSFAQKIDEEIPAIVDALEKMKNHVEEMQVLNQQLQYSNLLSNLLKMVSLEYLTTAVPE